MVWVKSSTKIIAKFVLNLYEMVGQRNNLLVQSRNGSILPKRSNNTSHVRRPYVVKVVVILFVIILKTMLASRPSAPFATTIRNHLLQTRKIVNGANCI